MPTRSARPPDTPSAPRRPTLASRPSAQPTAASARAVDPIAALEEAARRGAGDRFFGLRFEGGAATIDIDLEFSIGQSIPTTLRALPPIGTALAGAPTVTALVIRTHALRRLEVDRYSPEQILEIGLTQQTAASIDWSSLDPLDIPWVLARSSGRRADYVRVHPAVQPRWDELLRRAP